MSQIYFLRTKRYFPSLFIRTTFHVTSVCPVQSMWHRSARW